jgi:hypothetical protein
MICEVRFVPSRYAPILSSLCLLLYLMGAGRCMADAVGEAISPERSRELDSEIQVLKEEVLKINRDLQQLEQELLYPHDQQLVVFVSMVNDVPLVLKEVRLQLDGQPVAAHTYSHGEETALHAGGAHRIYVGGIRKGEHTLGVMVAGSNSQGHEFSRRESRAITPVTGVRYVELRVHSDPDGRKPAVSILEW